MEYDAREDMRCIHPLGVLFIEKYIRWGKRYTRTQEILVYREECE
jgi:hypothetical protein